jgi:hypothetical protein
MNHGPLFEAFKGLANVLANPWLSFSLASIALMLMLRFRRYVFNWWVGLVVIALEAAVVRFGMWDPNFKLIVGKPDNVPITIMLFLSTFCLWLAMTQAVNNERRAEQKLPSDERETSQQDVGVADLPRHWSLFADSVHGGLSCGDLAAAPGTTANPSPHRTSKGAWYLVAGDAGV